MDLLLGSSRSIDYPFRNLFKLQFFSFHSYEQCLNRERGCKYSIYQTTKEWQTNQQIRARLCHGVAMESSDKTLDGYVQNYIYIYIYRIYSYIIQWLNVQFHSTITRIK